MSHHEEHKQAEPKKKKRFYSKVTKYLMERDTMLATIWVFVFIFGLGALPINLGFFNPLKIALKDFDYNDFRYSKIGNHLIGNTDTSAIDKRITIVNIGNADREGIAMLIDKVASYKPKVMALDALFYEERDPAKDSLLKAVFQKHSNLIAAEQLQPIGKKEDTIKVLGKYINTASQYAYVNFFTDSMATLRYFQPAMKDYKNNTYLSFAVAVAKAYKPSSTKAIEKKINKDIAINYTRTTLQYQPIQFETVMMDGADATIFKDKIVLLGYLNYPDPSAPETYNPNDILDKKFTPMNPRVAGKTIPDMNGIVVHANIISMILDKNYIKKVPGWVNLLIAFAVCWLFMSFFIHYYLESHIWFHLVAKIAQVAALIFFTYLGIEIYGRYHLKVDMKLSLIVIIMAVDVIYFYEAWAVWMHKKFGYQTVFKPHHH
ncbi:MAG: hypothetical protein RL115_2545 [Bacteroidota bacterium]|jgi:CHASE2 domain-containing sensor protein